MASPPPAIEEGVTLLLEASEEAPEPWLAEWTDSALEPWQAAPLEETSEPRVGDTPDEAAEPRLVDTADTPEPVPVSIEPVPATVAWSGSVKSALGEVFALAGHGESFEPPAHPSPLVRDAMADTAVEAAIEDAARPRRRTADPGLARTDAGGRPRPPRGLVRLAGLLTHRHGSDRRATLGRRARPGRRSDLRFPGPRVPCGCRPHSRRGRRPRHFPPAEPSLSLRPGGDGGAGPADRGRQLYLLVDPRYEAAARDRAEEVGPDVLRPVPTSGVRPSAWIAAHCAREGVAHLVLESRVITLHEARLLQRGTGRRALGRHHRRHATRPRRRPSSRQGPGGTVDAARGRCAPFGGCPRHPRRRSRARRPHRTRCRGRDRRPHTGRRVFPRRLRHHRRQRSSQRACLTPGRRSAAWSRARWWCWTLAGSTADTAST